MQLGALAVLVRQTNIIWILFVACTGIIDHTLLAQKDKVQVDDSSVFDQKEDQLAFGKSAASGSNLRFGSYVDSSNQSTSKICPSFLQVLL